MPYIPGSPVEAYCTGCKADTSHVVLESEGIQIRLVRCDKCASENPFRAPRVKTKAALMEFAAKKKKLSAPPKPARRSRKPPPPSPEAVFQQLTEEMDMSTAVKYSAQESLHEGELVDHPIFGIGVVTALIDKQKAKVFFEDGERLMICKPR
ncbi:MAG: hypothetical protein GY847_20790 [Proteobacteria bacterium]|nr:hypothetical protein [Pseudomonadota bacterium]